MAMHGSRSLRSLASFALRTLSLGGRFIFTIFGAMWMTQKDFGIYALIASASMVIVLIAGLEMYQITLRRVAKRAEGADRDERPLYGRFILAAATASALGGAVFAYGFGWSPTVVLLSAGICFAEYLGTEATRILVAEKKSDLAMFSISTRFLPWNVGLPILSFVGILPRPWSIEFVLGSWLVSSVLGGLFLRAAAQQYFGRSDQPMKHWIAGMARQIPSWVAIAIAWRFLETGVRIVPGVLIDENASGQFAFYATLASIGSTGLKAVVEPFWFVRLLQPETATAARRSFALITLGWLAFAGILSSFLLLGLEIMGARQVGAEDWLLFAILLGSCFGLAMSQIPHFALYSAEQDRSILQVSIVALIVGIVASVLLTLAWGLPGTAFGTMIGTVTLAAGKAIAVRRLGALPILRPNA